MQCREPRQPCETQVTLVSGAEIGRAEFVNLNAHGGCIRGMHGLVRGGEVQVRFLDLRVHASVAWSRGARAGLRFEPPLSPTQFRVLLRQAGSQGFHPSSQDTFVFREMA